MRKNGTLLIIGLAWAAGSTPPAQAQVEQTAKGAQQFLKAWSEGVGNGLLVRDGAENGIWNVQQAMVTKNTFFPSVELVENYSSHGPFTISAIESPNDCITVIARVVAPAYPRLKQDGKSSYEVLPSKFVAPFKIDWSSVSATKWSVESLGTISAQGVLTQTQVHMVHIIGTKPHLALTVSGKDMAARLSYAAEFLRMNCDRAAATGF